MRGQLYGLQLICAWVTFAWWGNVYGGRANLCVGGTLRGGLIYSWITFTGAKLIFAWVTFCVAGLIFRGVAFTGAELMFAGNVWECG